MLNRRIYETIGLRYADVDRMPAILANVKKMLEEHADIDHRQILMVNFVSFGASAVEFFVYTFTETTDWQIYHQVKEDVLLKIAAIVDEQGAEIAFPTQTVHLQMQSEPGL
jgi:MscS family membrane protein